MLKKKNYLRLFVCAVLFFAVVGPLRAQTDDELVKATATALILFKQQRFAEAIPHLEKLVQRIPDDPKLRFMYGWSLLTKSKQINDTGEAKKLSAKALEQFQEAKKLGLKDAANDSLISMLSGQPAPAASCL